MSSDHLDAFDAQWGLEPGAAAGAPVFLLAAGWRSGSTLLQRLLCSSGEMLVWGEPYGRSGLISNLARTAFPLRHDWPASGVFTQDYSQLQDKWIANLYPEPQALKEGFRAMLDRVFAQPAKEAGFARWGVKEVRLHEIDGRFLNWVYPDARFLFMVRNPWDAWASAKGSQFVTLWPNKRVGTVQEFAQHWTHLASSFLRWPWNNGMLVRYEDLIQPTFELGQISEHCGLGPLDEAVRGKRIRGMQEAPQALSEQDVREIQRICGQVATSLSYQAPAVTTAAPQLYSL